MALTPFLVILGGAFCAMVLSWGYFGHYQINRPPLGVFNLRDILFMMGFIILIPFLYLWLPLYLAAGLLVVGALSIFYFAFEPVLKRSWVVWLLASGIIGCNLAMAVFGGKNSAFYFLVNNLTLIMLIVGITNLWVQSGLKARDAALFAILLAVYDFISTSLLPLTGEVLNRLAGLPLAPRLGWQVGETAYLMGLGDLLLASVFPLVMRKAFGREAGTIAILVNLVATSVVMLLPIGGIFPVMVVLGPLMLGQYLLWRKLKGHERKMWQYLEEKAFEKQ